MNMFWLVVGLGAPAVLAISLTVFPARVITCNGNATTDIPVKVAQSMKIAIIMSIYQRHEYANAEHTLHRYSDCPARGNGYLYSRRL
mgnify:FL=1